MEKYIGTGGLLNGVSKHQNLIRKGIKMKKKAKLPGRLNLTKDKVIRLVLFVTFVALTFTLKKYVPGIRTFGWGYAFGIVTMAILTG